MKEEMDIASGTTPANMLYKRLNTRLNILVMTIVSIGGYIFAIGFILLLIWFGYDTVRIEYELRANVESITKVATDVKKVEYLRESNYSYLLIFEYEDLVDTLRIDTTKLSDGTEIEAGTRLNLNLWKYKDGTEQLRLEDGTESVSDILFSP